MATVGKLGRYTVLRRLSSGGMGEVFVARQEGLAGFEKLVVVKTLRPDLAERQHFRDMFFEEARVSALARHSNVVSVLDVGIDHGVYYLVMEYIEGWALREVLEACSKAGELLPLVHALTIIIDLASGLDHIHGLRDAAGNALRLVHRDVSPENVMITVDGQSKLVDFGIAKRHGSPIVTEPGVLKGKARYLAPEQVRGQAISPATDQFALASVLFEMCTGEPLFPGKTTVEVMFALGRGSIRDAKAVRADLPDRLSEALGRALARDPKDRLASCGALADELMGIQTDHDMRATRADLVGFLEGHLEPPAGERVGATLGYPTTPEGASAVVPTAVGVAGRRRRKLSEQARQARNEATMPGAGSLDSGPLYNETSDDVGRSERDPSEPGLLGHETGRLRLEPIGRPGFSEASAEIVVGRLIGRVQEIDRIYSLFDSGARLVTLLGPGGVGKTSLARHHAYLERSRAVEGEIYFCDLSEARTLDEFAYATAEILSVPLTDEISWEDAVAHMGQALAGHSSILLIMDNLEQVIEPAADAISCWIDMAPEARFLATSREALNLAEEHRIELRPLARDEAVDLLCQRVRVVRPGWSPSISERSAAAEIVEQLDCLPLAIELAAARGGVLTMAQLLGRLTSGMDWLRSRRRDLSTRHASLVETIEWSWELLDPWERGALAQCSVFRGGFTLVAAEEVIVLPPEARCDVIDAVQSLREKSLLYTDTPRGAVEDELRFRMYESIRSFAAGKLGDAKRAEAAARHLAYYVAKADALAKGIDSTDGASCLDQMTASLDNFTAALDTAKGTEPALVVRLVVAVERMLAVHGPAHLHLEWLAAGLEAARRIDAIGDVSRLLKARGLASMRRGDSTAGWADLREAIDLGESLGDSLLIAESCEAMCIHHLQRRELTGQVEGYQERAYDIYRQLGDREGEARIMGCIALYHQRVGELDKARQHFDQAIALHERMGNVWAAGKLYGRRGLLCFERRLLEEARSDLEKSIAMVRQFGDVMREATNHLNMGCVELELGDHDKARRSVERAQSLYRRAGHLPSQALAHVNMAVIELDSGNLDAADENLDHAVRIARETEYHAWELMAVGNRGIVAQARGDLDEALGLLERVKEAHDRYPTSWASISTFLAHLASVQAALGDLEGARVTFAQCRDRIERGNHPESMAIVQCLEGFCNLAEAKRASSPDEATRHIERARRRAAHDSTDSCDLRIAQRLLERAVGAARDDKSAGQGDKEPG